MYIVDLMVLVILIIIIVILVKLMMGLFNNQNSSESYMNLAPAISPSYAPASLTTAHYPVIPTQVAHFNLPTRGFPDRFKQVGVLIRIKNKSNDDQNTILRLYGRQVYPGSNTYEYYTLVNSGLDKIEIPLNNKHNRELYTDDVIFIDELHTEYRVNIY